VRELINSADTNLQAVPFEIVFEGIR